MVSLSFLIVIMKITMYIEDITRWREDMNFIFEWQTIFYSRENKIHIFKPPCNVLLLHRQKDIDKIIEGNYRNYVIDKLICEVMENKSVGSRM